jgi:hypothetical protein
VPTRLLLEGTNIQQLLAQVRAEHGPAAKIVAADRIRPTGLAGLFSPQRYELTIEVADHSPTERPGLPSTATAAASTANGAGAVSPADALVALVEAQERQLLSYVGPDESAAADDAMQAAQEVGARTAVFADVLSDFGAPAWSVPVVSGLADPADPAPVMPPVAAPPISATPAQPTAAPIQPAITPEAQDAPLIPRYEPVRLSADAPLPTVLSHLGLPEQLRDRVTGFDSYRAIVKVLKLLPAAPTAPMRAGEVLVVVGELRGALSVARTVGESLRLTAARTVLAAASCAGTGIHPSRRLTGPEHAAKRIAKLRRNADMPIVVVVDIPADGSGTEWARSIIESLDATAVWGVVDATRKTADSARRLADIGHVDAIAAHASAATGDPAAVLQLGVPVAMLDGRVATPHVWADLLCRRLEEVIE